MRLIDSHCHLTHARLYGQVEEVLRRASAAGVTACVCASGDLSEAASAQKLCERFAGLEALPRLAFTAGLHPHEAKTAAEDLPRQIEEMLTDANCAAIGEIGLDYHYDFSPRPSQRQAFETQLELARRRGAKIVIHTREAFEDTLSIVRSSGVDCSRVVFHSCTEGPDNVRRILDTGAMVSFSGIVTFKNAGDLRRSAELVPDDKLLIETDSPYLSPEPVRTMRDNEPANVAHVAALLAQVRGASADSLAELTSRNAERFFFEGKKV